MADCGETDADLPWEFCRALPGRKKRKKGSKKDKKRLRDKSDIALKEAGGIQQKKKKRNSKFKEARKASKEKKKEKKKNKMRVPLGPDDGFMFSQGNSAPDPIAQWMRPEQNPAVKPASFSPRSPVMPKPHQVTRDFLPKKKTKKKVAFDLSPGCIRAKRPKFISPSAQSLQPKDDIPLENKSPRDSESLVRGTVTGQSRGPPQDNDSQCTGDDMNSQDLFITQKTFRASPSETSSGENNEDAIAATPLMMTGQDRGLHAPLTQLTLPHRRSDTLLPDPQRQAQNKLPHFHLNRLLNVHTLPVDEVLDTPGQDPKRANPYFQVHANLTAGTKASRLIRVRPKVVRPYLEQPMVVNTYLDVPKQPEDSCTSNQKIQRSPSCFRPTDKPFPSPPMSNTSTQTENFFTTELCSYLRFYQQSRVAVSREDLKPMDLSLPQRARADLGRCSVIEVKVRDDKCGDQKPSSSLVEIKDGSDKEPSGCPSYSSEVKDSIENKEPSGQRPWSSIKAETTPSPQSESEPKSSDTATSTEDNEPNWRSSKLDLTQVRAVQMRLNESFFFKTKGEGRSPRPESPLMKLTQSRGKKSRKQC